MPKGGEEGKCELCGNIKTLSFHHLIPRSTHKNKWFRKNFTKDEMLLKGLKVCRGCHSFLHKTYTEKELGKNFNTKEKILSDEKLMKYISWARKH